MLNEEAIGIDAIEADRRVRADDAVRVLRAGLARWRGRDAGRSVRWYARGVSGEPSEETVAVSLSVVEAEALARLLLAVPPRDG